MKPTFAQLREHLSHPEVKELINLFNNLYDLADYYPLNRVWQRNYNTLAEILYDNDYRGPYTFNRLEKFIKSFDEEQKRYQKQQDDELFGKHTEWIDKRHLRNKQQQHKQQRKSYKQGLKNRAITERELMDISYETEGKSENRKEHKIKISSSNR